MKKMKKGWKITLIIIASLLVLLVLGPLVIPIPPAKNTQPVQAFTDADSQFVEINGLNVHYKMAGAGNPVFILLHGFGASTFSWREVIEPFSNYGTVIAYDRPAFGLTERPVTWEGENPYSMESNVAILLGLLDVMDVEEAILVGNSAGGTVATAFTLAYPGRVQALIEVDAAIYQTMPDSPLLTWFLNTPQMDRLGPLVARWAANRQADAFLASAWYDTVVLEQNPQIIEGYFIPFEVDHWDRALWEHTQVTRSPDLADRLDEIEVPTLVISGQYDQIVPLALSQQLAVDIPGATLTVLPNCGHLPQEECPGAFLAAIDNFLVEMERTNE